MNRFEFDFQLSEKQFRDAHRAYLRRTLISFKNLFMLTIALLIGLVQAQLFGGLQIVTWIFVGLWFAVIGLVLFVYIWMPGRVFRARLELSARQHLVVDADGIDWNSGEKSRVISWKEVQRASDLHPDYIYFHFKNRLPEILPKSVFRSDDELREFDRFVRAQLVS